MTVVNAIKKALSDIGEAATYEEIYNMIVEKKYYIFNAENPQSVVRVQLKRHCSNAVIPSAVNTNKYFFSLGGKGREEKFELLPVPVKKKNVVNNNNTFILNKPSLQQRFNHVVKIDFSAHKNTTLECFWMLLGSFIPIIVDSILRILALDVSVSDAFGDNVKGGEVFLLTSVLITPFYFFLIKYIGSDSETRKENKLPFFGFVFFMSIVVFFSGLFAFTYYRIGRLVAEKSGSDIVKAMFQYDFGPWAWAIYFMSLIIWYYSSYMSNRPVSGYRNIREKQLTKLKEQVEKE